jgi:hypothetical protein
MLFKLNTPARDGERFKLSNKVESVCRECLSLQFCYKNWENGMMVTQGCLNMVVKRRTLIVFKHWIWYESKLNDIKHRARLTQFAILKIMFCVEPAKTNPSSSSPLMFQSLNLRFLPAKNSLSSHPLVCIPLCVTLAFMRATENIVRLIGRMNCMITQLPHGL